MKIFGSKELLKCLKCLGFAPRPKIASAHVKFDPPKEKKENKTDYPFIMVQLGRKTYDKNACARYITQIKRFGFTKKEIMGCFK